MAGLSAPRSSSGEHPSMRDVVMLLPSASL